MYTISQNQSHIPITKTGASSLVGGGEHAVDHALDRVNPPGAGDRGPRPGQVGRAGQGGSLLRHGPHVTYRPGEEAFQIPQNMSSPV